jgi:hypothetical protein
MRVREGFMAFTTILVAAAPPAPAMAETQQQIANESAPKSWTMAAEVLARLEATKNYRELSALYNSKVAADTNWLQSAEGRAVDAQLKTWRRDAAATAIADDKDGRTLRYSVGGVVVRDAGVAAADLEKSPAYRRTIAEAIAQNILTSPLDPNVRAALAAFRNPSEAPSAAAGGPAGPGVSIIGVYQSANNGMGVAIVSTTDPEEKAALFAADIGQLDQPTARLNVFFGAVQWRQFAQIWLKARRTVPPRDGFGTEVGHYFDPVAKSSISVTVDKDGSITFAIVGKPEGKLVTGLIEIKTSDFGRFDETVKTLTDYFAAAPAIAAAGSAQAAASNTFCAQIQAIVADAPNSFAAFRGQLTRQERSQVPPPTTVDHYTASGTPAGAAACEITANDAPTSGGLYLPNYTCEFPIAGTNKGAETQKLARRVAACLPGISRPMGPGLSKDSGMLTAHSSDYALSYLFLSGPAKQTIRFSVQNGRK